MQPGGEFGASLRDLAQAVRVADTLVCARRGPSAVRDTVARRERCSLREWRERGRRAARGHRYVCATRRIARRTGDALTTDTSLLTAAETIWASIRYSRARSKPSRNPGSARDSLDECNSPTSCVPPRQRGKKGKGSRPDGSRRRSAQGSGRSLGRYSDGADRPRPGTPSLFQHIICDLVSGVVIDLRGNAPRTGGSRELERRRRTARGVRRRLVIGIVPRGGCEPRPAGGKEPRTSRGGIWGRHFDGKGQMRWSPLRSPSWASLTCSSETLEPGRQTT